MRITKKLYIELYEYFWNLEDIKSCAKLKALFYNQPKNGTYLSRDRIIEEVIK